MQKVRTCWKAKNDGSFETKGEGGRNVWEESKMKGESKAIEEDSNTQTREK